MIESKNPTRAELKEYVVDKQNYCSKTQFYNYIREFQMENKITELLADGKRILVPENSRKFPGKVREKSGTG